MEPWTILRTGSLSCMLPTIISVLLVGWYAAASSSGPILVRTSSWAFDGALTFVPVLYRKGPTQSHSENGLLVIPITKDGVVIRGSSEEAHPCSWLSLISTLRVGSGVKKVRILTGADHLSSQIQPYIKTESSAIKFFTASRVLFRDRARRSCSDRPRFFACHRKVHRARDHAESMDSGKNERLKIIRPCC